MGVNDNDIDTVVDNQSIRAREASAVAAIKAAIMLFLRGLSFFHLQSGRKVHAGMKVPF